MSTNKRDLFLRLLVIGLAVLNFFTWKELSDAKSENLELKARLALITNRTIADTPLVSKPPVIEGGTFNGASIIWYSNTPFIRLAFPDNPRARNKAR